MSTKNTNTPPSVACKDCAREGRTTNRPIALDRSGEPVPGGRCATHHRQHTAATRKRAAARRRENIYGLTDEQHATILAYQGGTCAVCGKARGLRRALSVDHNHHTGAIRGLLCDPCNRIVIGRYDVNSLTRAIAYLYDPPAPRALGYTITVPTNTNTLCAHNGGQGIGAGHTCRCNRETGHPHDSDRPHGCECGALWADQP